MARVILSGLIRFLCGMVEATTYSAPNVWASAATESKAVSRRWYSAIMDVARRPFCRSIR